MLTTAQRLHLHNYLTTIKCEVNRKKLQIMTITNGRLEQHLKVYQNENHLWTRSYFLSCFISSKTVDSNNKFYLFRPRKFSGSHTLSTFNDRLLLYFSIHWAHPEEANSKWTSKEILQLDKKEFPPIYGTDTTLYNTHNPV